MVIFGLKRVRLIYFAPRKVYSGVHYDVIHVYSLVIVIVPVILLE